MENLQNQKDQIHTYQKMNTNIKNNTMDKYWSENIYQTINGFADLDRQKSSWGGMNSQIVSSYVEDYNLLFYSFDFDDFIESWRNEKLDVEIMEELILFRNKLINYDNSISEEMQREDIKILKDINWEIVVSQASRVMQLWKLHENI